MKSMLASALKSGVAALASFVIGAFVVAFARDPMLQTVVPRVMAMMGDRQVLQIFQVDQAGGISAVSAEYSVYDAGFGNEVRGRVIRHLNGKDNNDEQSYIIGAKRDDLVTFSYRSVREDRTGAGSFIGKLDPEAEVHVGEVVGYAREKKGDDCRVMRFVAVLGSKEHTARFLEVARAAAARTPHVSSSLGGTLACKTTTASAAEQ